MKIKTEELTRRIFESLRAAGANETMASSTARSLVLAEAQGLGSHGLSRIGQYTTHLRNGRVDGRAVARVVKRKRAALLIDAAHGLAFPACELAVAEAVAAARDNGVAIVGVINSHHCGVVVDHLRAAAAAGMVGLGFSNSPSAMPAAGGRHPIFGTNPVAAVFPRASAEPLLIDLSLSEVARGKVMVAAKKGEAIPLGWALDVDGEPTTDAKAALAGSMLPIGAVSSPKGAMLALTVELLVTALIGANFGFEASSFFIDEGNQPQLGQLFIVIDPEPFAGSGAYLERVEVLLEEMLKDDGVRLPGVRRETLRQRALSEGIEVADAMLAQLEMR